MSGSLIAVKLAQLHYLVLKEVPGHSVGNQSINLSVCILMFFLGSEISDSASVSVHDKSRTLNCLLT